MQYSRHPLTGSRPAKLTWFDLSCPQDFVVPRPYKKFVPLPSAVSIPFFIGAPIAIDFCLGGAIMLAWYALLTIGGYLRNARRIGSSQRGAIA